MKFKKLPVFVIVDKQVVKITKYLELRNGYETYYWGHLAGGGPHFVIYDSMIDDVPNQKIMEILYGKLPRKNQKKAS